MKTIPLIKYVKMGQKKLKTSKNELLYFLITEQLLYDD